MERYASGILCFLVLGIVGCGDDGLKSPTALRMSGLANSYLDMSYQGGPPANEDALKKHMGAMHPGEQYSRNIDSKNIDACFKSERDNEPLVVVYGIKPEISGQSKQVIAHEKTGKNGKRLVVFASTKVASVSEAELEQLKSAKPSDKDKKETDKK